MPLSLWAVSVTALVVCQTQSRLKVAAKIGAMMKPGLSTKVRRTAASMGREAAIGASTLPRPLS